MVHNFNGSHCVGRSFTRHGRFSRRPDIYTIPRLETKMSQSGIASDDLSSSQRGGITPPNGMVCCGIHMFIDMRIGMHADTRHACATHRLRVLIETVLVCAGEFLPLYQTCPKTAKENKEMPSPQRGSITQPSSMVHACALPCAYARRVCALVHGTRMRAVWAALHAHHVEHVQMQHTVHTDRADATLP